MAGGGEAGGVVDTGADDAFGDENAPAAQPPVDGMHVKPRVLGEVIGQFLGGGGFQAKVQLLGDAVGEDLDSGRQAQGAGAGRPILGGGGEPGE